MVDVPVVLREVSPEKKGRHTRCLTVEETTELGLHAATVDNVPLVELHTRGGGPCAIHAAFGNEMATSTDGDRMVTTLFHPDPRGLLRTALCKPLSAVRGVLTDAGRHRLDMLLTKVWADFILPCVQPDGRLNYRRHPMGSEEYQFVKRLGQKPEYAAIKTRIEEQLRGCRTCSRTTRLLWRRSAKKR